MVRRERRGSRSCLGCGLRKAFADFRAGACEGAAVCAAGVRAGRHLDVYTDGGCDCWGLWVVQEPGFCGFATRAWCFFARRLDTSIHEKLGSLSCE